MRGLFMAVLMMSVVGVSAAEAPTWTDAQLLKVERHKSGVLMYQIQRAALDQRLKDLQVEELALNKDLCGDGTFDYTTSACVEAAASK